MVLDGFGSVYDDTGWDLVRISWYCLILGGTQVQGQQRACMPVYIGKKWRFGRVLPMPDIHTDNRIKGYSACIKYKV